VPGHAKREAVALGAVQAVVRGLETNLKDEDATACVVQCIQTLRSLALKNGRMDSTANATRTETFAHTAAAAAAAAAALCSCPRSGDQRTSVIRHPECHDPYLGVNTHTLHGGCRSCIGPALCRMREQRCVGVAQPITPPTMRLLLLLRCAVLIGEHVCIHRGQRGSSEAVVRAVVHSGARPCSAGGHPAQEHVPDSMFAVSLFLLLHPRRQCRPLLLLPSGLCVGATPLPPVCVSCCASCIV